MSKLKDHIIKQEEHSRLVFDNLRDALANAQEYKRKQDSAVHKDQQEEFLFNPRGTTMREWQAPMSIEKFTHKRNELKHQSTQTWGVDMPDLEGEALADAEKQFDYDSWLGEHGIGE